MQDEQLTCRASNVNIRVLVEVGVAVTVGVSVSCKSISNGSSM